MNEFLVCFLIWYFIGFFTLIFINIYAGKITIKDLLESFLYGLLGIITILVIIGIYVSENDKIIWEKKDKEK